MELSTFDSLRYQSPFVLLAISLGATSALRFFLLVLKCLYVLFLRPSKNLAKYGRWAVITGPTDGIGKEMAMEFARKGLNLVLVGRNPEKLNKVSAELREVNSAVKLKTVVMDLSDEIQLRVLIDAVKDVDMGILVNNAGLANEDPVHFHQLGEDTTMKIVNVNLVAPTMITAALLPEMLRKGRGAIINVGSGSTDLPSFPFYSVYAGTKGYIKQFSKNLHIEYKQRDSKLSCNKDGINVFLFIFCGNSVSIRVFSIAMDRLRLAL
ncbi:very-long-chain 3-oxoacyl-CoA reductase 1-like isoform X2 [Wolffia australiana]